MQHINLANGVGIYIQEDEAKEGVALKFAGLNEVALLLSVRQARTFASDLIQHAHRIEVKQSIKRAKAAA